MLRGILVNYVKKIQNKQQPSTKILNKIITHYRKSVSIDSNYYSSYNNLGYIYLNYKNNIDSSLFFYLKAIHANSNYLEANYGAGLCYVKRNDFVKANQYFKNAIEVDSLYAPAWVEYAKIQFANKDETTAFNILNNVSKMDTLSDLAYITLGNFSLIKSDTSSAVEYWEQAIQRNPNNPQLLFGLYKYFSQIKKVKKSTHYKNLFDKYSVK